MSAACAKEHWGLGGYCLGVTDPLSLVAGLGAEGVSGCEVSPPGGGAGWSGSPSPESRLKQAWRSAASGPGTRLHPGAEKGSYAAAVTPFRSPSPALRHNFCSMSHLPALPSLFCSIIFCLYQATPSHPHNCLSGLWNTLPQNTARGHREYLTPERSGDSGFRRASDLPLPQVTGPQGEEPTSREGAC